MTNAELLEQLETFQRDLEQHRQLWGDSLDDTSPDLPQTNLEELRSQCRSLARRLGAIQLYLRNLRPNWAIGASGVTWDALEEAVRSEQTAAIKGPSLDAVIDGIDQVIGQLQGQSPDQEASLGGRTPDNSVRPAPVNQPRPWHRSRSIQAALIGAAATILVGILSWLWSSAPSQTATIVDSANTTVYQAGRDVLVAPPSVSHPSSAPATLIESLAIEVRLTSTVMPGAELPPDEVPFVPLGDSDAYLEGSAGRIRLAFQTPVRFRQLGGGRLIVANRFSLASGSELFRRPLGVLRNYERLSVPVVTIVWGKALETIRLLEVSLFVNNEGPYYGSWTYNVPFKQGPRFSIALDPFADRILGPVK